MDAERKKMEACLSVRQKQDVVLLLTASRWPPAQGQGQVFVERCQRSVHDLPSREKHLYKKRFTWHRTCHSGLRDYGEEVRQLSSLHQTLTHLCVTSAADSAHHRSACIATTKHMPYSYHGRDPS